MKSRGIVVTGYLADDGSLHFSPTAEDLRRFLTYWDVVDVPMVNGIGLSTSFGELELLSKEGILVTSRVSMAAPVWDGPTHGGSINGLPYSVWVDFWRTAAIEVVKAQNENSDLHWAYGQQKGDLILPTHRNNPKSEVLSFGLYNCLPVPEATVSFESILKFKQRRTAELASFRVAMDELRDQLLKAENLNAAFANARDKLSKRVHDVDRVMAEEKWGKRMSSLETFIRLPAAASTALLIGTLTQSAEIGALAGMGTSAVLSAARRFVDSKFTTTRHDSEAFAYVHDVSEFSHGK